MSPSPWPSSSIRWALSPATTTLTLYWLVEFSVR